MKLLNKSLLGITLGIVVFMLAVSGCSSKKQDTSAKKAFSFKVQKLDGSVASLDDYQGKVLILDFWDTWCPPCRKEIPHFVELYSEYQGRGLEILGVAGGREGLDAVRNFEKEYGINYTNSLMNEEIIKGYGGISSIPTTFIIDQKGNIYKKYVGYNSKETFEMDVKTLLGI